MMVPASRNYNLVSLLYSLGPGFVHKEFRMEYLDGVGVKETFSLNVAEV